MVRSNIPIYADFRLYAATVCTAIPQTIRRRISNRCYVYIKKFVRNFVSIPSSSNSSASKAAAAGICAVYEWRGAQRASGTPAGAASGPRRVPALRRNVRPALPHRPIPVKPRPRSVLYPFICEIPCAPSQIYAGSVTPGLHIKNRPEQKYTRSGQPASDIPHIWI